MTSKRFALRLRSPQNAATVRIRAVLRRHGRVVATSRPVRIRIAGTGTKAPLAPAIPPPPSGPGTPPEVPGDLHTPAAQASPDDVRAPFAETAADDGTVYPDRSTRITRDGVTLAVPAGTVSSPAMASIRSVDPSEVAPGGFGADVHIDANWQDGQKAVRITMPQDPDALAAGYEPAVLHYRPSGVEIMQGPALEVSGDSVTFETTSLSRFVSTSLPRSWRITTGITTSDRALLQNMIRRFVSLRADQPHCHPDITTTLRVESTGSAFVKSSQIGNQEPIKYCVGFRAAAGTEFERGRWTLANNTGAVLAYNIAAPGVGVNLEPAKDLLTDIVFATLNQDGDSANDGVLHGPVYIPPGGALDVTVPAGQVGRVTMSTAPALQIPAFVFRQIGELVETKNDAVEIYDRINECGYSLVASGLSDLVDALHCAREILAQAGSRLAKIVGKVLVTADALLTSVDTLTFSLAPVRAELSYATATTEPALDRRFDWTAPLIEQAVNVNGDDVLPVPVARRTASVSDSGRFVAFTSGSPTDYEATTSVFVHDRTTGLSDRIGEGWRPVISGDGQHLAYDTNSGLSNLLIYDLDKPAVHVVPIAAEYLRDFAISDDGNVVAYLAYAPYGQPRAFLYRRDTGRTLEIELTTRPSIDYSYANVWLSGQGTVAVFTAQHRFGSNPGLVAYDLDTGRDEPITDDVDGNADVGISSDGRYVVYGGYNYPSGLRQGEVYRVDRQSHTTTQLTTDTPTFDVHGGTHISISDSGRYVAYLRTYARPTYAEVVKTEYVVEDTSDGSVGVVPQLSVPWSFAVADPVITGNGNGVLFFRNINDAVIRATLHLVQAPSHDS